MCVSLLSICEQKSLPMLMNAYRSDFLVLNKLLYGITIIERILNAVFSRRHYQTNYLFIALFTHKNHFMFKLNRQYITRIAVN